MMDSFANIGSLEILYSYLHEDKFREKAASLPNGLLGGKAGLIFLLFLLYKAKKDKSIRLNAYRLLQELAHDFENICNLGFKDGICGIGFLIELLHQNRLIGKVNTDIILENVDDILYKSVIHKADNTIDLFNGSLGKIIYFWARFNSKNDTNRYRTLSHKECLNLLVEDIYEKTSEIDFNLFFKNKDVNDTIINFSNIVLIFSSLVHTKVSLSKVEEILYRCIEYMKIVLNSTILCINDDVYLYLCICLFVAGLNFNHNGWVSYASSKLDFKADHMSSLELLDANLVFSAVSLWKMYSRKNEVLHEIYQDMHSDLLYKHFKKISWQKRALYELMISSPGDIKKNSSILLCVS